MKLKKQIVLECEGLNYSEIMALGFTEEIAPDNIYQNDYGYDYAIITLQLKKRISLCYSKDQRVVTMYYCDKEGFILAEFLITSIKAVTSIIEFYAKKNKRKQ
tara:strand:+ start:148 stop:456 length:309 start_codon:yes stop_codon:yes gene_type:complete